MKYVTNSTIAKYMADMPFPSTNRVNLENEFVSHSTISIVLFCFFVENFGFKSNITLFFYLTKYIIFKYAWNKRCNMYIAKKYSRFGWNALTNFVFKIICFKYYGRIKLIRLQRQIDVKIWSTFSGFFSQKLDDILLCVQLIISVY